MNNKIIMSLIFSALTVREGDAFLLEDDGWKCLFDSGRDKSIVDLLKFKGIDKLDLAICSHNDADHAEGFIELFKSGFQINEIWLPGLWASVLHFVKENFENCRDVVFDNELYEGGLDSLFSEESVSDETFIRDIYFLDEMKSSESFQEYCYCLLGKLARYITDNPGIKDLLSSDLQKKIVKEYHEGYREKQVDDYLEDLLIECYRWEYTHKRDVHDIKEFIKERLHRLDCYEQTRNNIIESLDLKLNKIISIATYASRQGCTITWFRPSSSCTKEDVGFGFVPLNSSKMCRIRMPKSSVAYMYLLCLTEENKHSLVFEYIKKGVPLIRFSADSDCTCQSVYPYRENIIVTAPHHGSDANAIVYKTIHGDDLIWVRSDKKSNKRPCAEFKSRKNKYCLACKQYNFKTEICFEYNSELKRWDFVSGEQCRCK